jgi:hypothetical protein
MAKRQLKELSITIHVGETTPPTLWVSSKNNAGYVDEKAVRITVYNAVENAVKKLGYEVGIAPIL